MGMSKRSKSKVSYDLAMDGYKSTF